VINTICFERDCERTDWQIRFPLVRIEAALIIIKSGSKAPRRARASLPLATLSTWYPLRVRPATKEGRSARFPSINSIFAFIELPWRQSHRYRNFDALIINMLELLD